MGAVNVVLKLFGGSHGHSGTFRMDDFVLNGFVQEESSGFSSSDYFVSRNYRNSFQGQEHHDEIRGKGNYINYKYRGHDPRIGRLDWLVDPLSADYPWNSPYAFSENRVLDGVELEGLEFLDKDDALFKMIGGELYLKVENAGHWTKKRLENKIPASRTANGHNQIGAYPLLNSPVVSVENPLAPKSLVGPNGRKSSQMTTEQNLAAQQPNNRQTRRQNARNGFTPYPSGTRSGAKGIIALNIIIKGVEKWREYSLEFDDDELDSQLQNYFFRTVEIIDKASKDGLIPIEYYNTDDYSKLFNVILYGGEDNYGSDEIRALGIFIYRKYTNNSGIYLDLIPESVKNNVGNDTENE